MNLLKELTKRKILTQKEALFIEEETTSSGKKAEDIILSKEILSEEDLFRIKSEIIKVPLREEISEKIDLETLEVIPEESARYYKMVPILKRKDKIDIGMIYPEDLKAREALGFLADQNRIDYDVFLIIPSDFEKIIKRYRTLKEEVKKALEELEEDSAEDNRPKIDEKINDSEKIIEDAPISKMVSVILRHAADGDASDIHIEPGKKGVRVRFRVDGILYSSIFLPSKIHPAIVSRIKIMSSLKIDEKRMPQDGRFSIKMKEKEIDFRVSTLPTSFGEKVVIRILDSSQKNSDFQSLGIVGRNLELIEKTIKKPFGMILSTGPTGSGKTTTLYTILGILNEEKRNVVTLEDPVEYFMDGVNQSQVMSEIGYTFASGLRHILRQDPDALMVGEIRDEETASLAIHAALTGHIVLSTLHTSNSFGVIPRMVDMGVKKFLIPPTLKIAIAQRLVRKLCFNCRKKANLDSGLKEMLKKEIASIPPQEREKIGVSENMEEIHEAVGCNKCRNIGYSGRVGLYEILEITEDIKDIIFKDPSESAIKKESYKQGMVTMRQDGIIKVLKGLTTIEEIIRVTEES